MGGPTARRDAPCAAVPATPRARTCHPCRPAWCARHDGRRPTIRWARPSVRTWIGPKPCSDSHRRIDVGVNWCTCSGMRHGHRSPDTVRDHDAQFGTRTASQPPGRNQPRMSVANAARSGTCSTRWKARTRSYWSGNPESDGCPADAEVGVRVGVAAGADGQRRQVEAVGIPPAVGERGDGLTCRAPDLERAARLVDPCASPSRSAPPRSGDAPPRPPATTRTRPTRRPRWSARRGPAGGRACTHRTRRARRRSRASCSVGRAADGATIGVTAVDETGTGRIGEIGRGNHDQPPVRTGLTSTCERTAAADDGDGRGGDEPVAGTETGDLRHDEVADRDARDGGEHDRRDEPTGADPGAEHQGERGAGEADRLEADHQRAGVDGEPERLDHPLEEAPGKGPGQDDGNGGGALPLLADHVREEEPDRDRRDGAEDADRGQHQQRAPVGGLAVVLAFRREAGEPPAQHDGAERRRGRARRRGSRARSWRRPSGRAAGRPARSRCFG